MQTYCLGCKKYTNINGTKKVTMTNQVIRDISRCSSCMAYKSIFFKQKHSKKSGWNSINPKLFIYLSL